MKLMSLDFFCYFKNSYCWASSLHILSYYTIFFFFFFERLFYFFFTFFLATFVLGLLWFFFIFTWKLGFQFIILAGLPAINTILKTHFSILGFFWFFFIFSFMWDFRGDHSFFLSVSPFFNITYTTVTKLFIFNPLPGLTLLFFVYLPYPKISHFTFAI